MRRPDDDDRTTQRNGMANAPKEPRAALSRPAITSLLTRRKAAAQLAVCVSTLDRLVRDGMLVPTRIGSRVFLSTDEVVDFIERRTDQRSEDPA